MISQKASPGSPGFTATPGTTHARRNGTLVGLAIAALFLADASRGGSGAGESAISVTYGVSTLLAGGLGGWMFGPAAMRATTGRNWVGVIVGLAAMAVVVGAFGATFPLAWNIAWELDLDPLSRLVRAVPYWMAFATTGILILGLPALLLTIVPAGLWAAAMAWLKGRGQAS